MHTHLSWVWVGLIALYGLGLLWRPKLLAADCGSLRLFRIAEPDEQQRALSALERRTQAEQVSATPGYVGAAGAFVLAAVGAITTIPPVLLYGLFCLWLAAIIALMFLQLRNAQPKRVAVLAPRSPARVIPLWIVALAVVDAVTPLAYASQSQFTSGAILICCSTLATLLVAWRLTYMPALLQGDDVPAEVFIDNRLRAHRTAALLLLTVVQPFAFLSQLEQTTNIEQAAIALSFAVFICVALFALRGLFRTTSLSPA
jgi:hypothetical protein